MSLIGADRAIDARSIVTLVVFFVVNILVIFPVSIPFPLRIFKRKLKFPLGLQTAPVIGVLLLLASTCIPGSVVRDGIVGSGGVRPYDILVLFISFAYISLSLDCTGLLQYLAFAVAMRSGTSGSGPRLYASFYAFFALSGLVVGNDPIILSGTPFLVYFTEHAAISPPTAFLFTQFQASNLVSALLVSSNPTNLVLTSAFGVSFLGYSAWLALPVVAGIVVLFPLLRYGVFASVRLVPKKLHPPRVVPRDALVDPVGAVFGATLFGITIVLLIGLSAAGRLEGVKGVWTITAPAAILMVIRDCFHDLRKAHSEPKADETKQEAIELEAPESEDPTLRIPDGASPAEAASLEGSQSPSETSYVVRLVSKARTTLPTFTTVVSKLPLPLLPFAFSMFILVEALQYTGWIRVFSGWWSSWARVGGIAGCVWLMGVLGVLGCNVFGTNIGATILLSRVLQQWHALQPDISQRSLYGSIFSLAIASNYGAYSFVFSASLAGLLWRDILSQKSIVITQWEFIRWNTVPVIVTMIVSCLVVAGEVCVMYDT
ncbi:hypothetical protein P7C73_g6294, partial [Tremellales sp. Uapishka_1]